MTYKTIDINPVDAGRSHILVGSITEVGFCEVGEGFVADVDIDDYGAFSSIPIFYHCQNAESQVEEEATKGNPFVVGDRVLILNTGDATEELSVDNMEVFGFEDGLPRYCGFQFKITRGDGTVITEDFGLSFQCRNASGTYFIPDNILYNENTGYWSFGIPFGNVDPGGYWVKFSDIDDSIDTVYPMKYKVAEQYQAEDLIQIGRYDADVPYWVISTSHSPEPTMIYGAPSIAFECADLSFLGPNGVMRHIWDYQNIDLYYLGAGKSFSIITNVKSSIPYKTTRTVAMHGVRCHGKYEYQSHWYDPFEPCYPALPTCYEGDMVCINSSGAGTINFSGDSLNFDYNWYDFPDPIILEDVHPTGSVTGRDHALKITEKSSEECQFISGNPSFEGGWPCPEWETGTLKFTYFGQVYGLSVPDWSLEVEYDF